MVHVGLHSVGTYHKKFGRENKKNKKVICRVSTNDTRQRMVCRVLAVQHSAKDCKRFFAECHPAGTRQRTLCRVPAIWHSAKNILIFLKNLCRVPAIWHSAKPLNNKPVVFLSSSLPHTLSIYFHRSRRRPSRAAGHGRRQPARPAIPRAAPTCAAPAPSATGHGILRRRPRHRSGPAILPAPAISAIPPLRPSPPTTVTPTKVYDKFLYEIVIRS